MSDDKNSPYDREITLVVTLRSKRQQILSMNIEEAIMSLLSPDSDWVSAHIYWPGIEDGDINLRAWDMSFVPMDISQFYPEQDYSDEGEDSTPADMLDLRGIE
jgi:hypothetical protein